MSKGLLIKGGKIVNADKTFNGDIYCENGVIKRIAPSIERESIAPDARVIDANGKIIVPGGIDTHTHFQLPFMGTVAIDDFFHGTRAAVVGGTTTVIDFVIPSPGESLIKSFDKWRDWAQKSFCDYAFHVVVSWWSDQVKEEMGILARERGVTSFKHFMAYKGSLMLNDEGLVNSFSRAKELGCVSTVHAENGEMILLLQKKLLAQGITGPEGHPWSRPPPIEAEATNRATRIAQVINTPLYIVHVSCKEAMEVIHRARREGQTVFGEVLAGHLTIDDSVYMNTDWNKAAAYVMSPPFRAKEHQEELWKGLHCDALHTTATDNCTFCAQQKEMGKDDFTKIPNGTNGVEDRMSIVWSYGVNTGRITMNQFVAVTSTNAAKIFNMYPKKGVIAEGSDADLVIIDPTVERTISKDTQWQRVDSNIWEGWNIKGVNVYTILKGEVAWEASVENHVANWNKGKFALSEPKGQYLARPAFGYAFEGIAEKDNFNAKKAVERK
eukprot:TRINITY_DN3981_c0_g1_i1.p1 TRINITY_DN3981_c0_g1~~TRINITY_DN3981_c0_g1_i1.p1  ORF type:complete len:497 (-),score=121.04 TRINITY_DN3981_c0_g1_i1:73-1563(-)